MGTAVAGVVLAYLYVVTGSLILPIIVHILLQEPLSSDIVSLCALIARIMIRCLSEKNPQVMEILSLPSQAEKTQTGETHDAV